MLQQTTVATVARRFDSFVSRFPSVHALAQAEEGDVLQAWQGLGYYRRARHLHAAARRIVEEYHGRFPDHPTLCLELPGMGPYLVNAFLSQAFERRLPILEANTERLYCRLLNEFGDPRTLPVRQRLISLAASLLPRRRVGDFNQALMELGALVCLPRQPRCSECPLSAVCAAHQAGTQGVIPSRPPRSPYRRCVEVGLVIWRGHRALILQRPSEGRWPLLWEFPRGALRSNETSEQAVVRLAHELARIEIRLRRPIGTLQYSVLRDRVTVNCWEAQWQAGRVRTTWHVSSKWLPIDAWSTLPSSSPQRRFAHLVGQKALGKDWA